MAILLVTSIQYTTVWVKRDSSPTEVVVVQSFNRLGSTELYTVTLGSGEPTDAGPAAAATTASFVLSASSDGVSQDTLGGIIGGIVGFIIVVLLAFFWFGRIWMPRMSSSESSGARSKSSGSSQRDGNGSRSISESTSEMTEEDWDDQPRPRPGPGPGRNMGTMPGGPMPGATWGGPLPGMGQPPGTFPMNGMGRGGPPMMGRGTPMLRPQ
ncbi:hypothetical protein TruAng_005337 [Truncatella angustata]|nr:hypothetical protein TruAng_005337 [Truncatella angustata]